ncbi:hypothetical protein PG993_009345 [Apiospora rasikravindrae]|uniref:Dipeptidase n=1 Tax=Apiospora rasikravindrae TaxID=990691 RepID=A0ABR1SJ48_9PEZI
MVNLICTFISTSLLITGPVYASYAFYVGKGLTADGVVMVGGTGEEVSSHWLQIFPAADHAPNATITVGVTQDAVKPGRLIQIPQVAHTFRYVSMEYSDFEGFPAPLTNGGVNERGVAVRDVWADSRDELYDMTPDPQTGLQYSDLARIVLERAATAREGVEIIGRLIDEYGEATYGGNSHLIADKDEGWVVWEFAGGQKLWAAERLGPDDVRVLYPGYIEDFPVNFTGSRDYMGSGHLVDFAAERGWWDPKSGKPFNIFKAYGKQGDNYTARDGGFKYMSQAQLEEATRAMAPVTEKDLMKRVRDPRISDDEASYGQVVSLYPDLDADLIRIWNAPTGSVAAPFLPSWLGIDVVLPEYGQHRYLTTGASSSFLNPDFELQEASVFAGRLFKRVLYYMCSAPAEFHPIVTDMLVAFENQSLADIEWVEAGARALLKKGQRAAAKSLLQFYAHARARDALGLGRTLTDALDAYIKLAGKWKGPTGTQINDAGEGAETVNCLVGFDPDQPAWKQPPPSPSKKRLVFQAPSAQ